MAAGKLGSDKEVQAITVNTKEERTLEKSLHTLNLEENYTIKLIEFDQRGVKLGQRRLQRCVSKIRSQLTPEDIATYRVQERNGSFKPQYREVNMSGAHRIAAAAKRLKFECDEGNVTKKTIKIPLKSSTSTAKPQGLPFFQSSSSEHAPNPRRRSSADGRLGERPERETYNRTSNNLRSQSSTLKIVRPVTSHGFASKNNRPIAVRPHTTSGYSSHSTINTQGQREDAVSMRQTPATSEQSLPGESSAENLRRKLLKGVLWHNGNIDRRRKSFLVRISNWMEESAKSDSLKADAGIKLSTPLKPKRTAFSAGNTKEDTTKRLIGAWKDLNKCRYLRIKPELVDYSGVNTLASDQMKLYTSLLSHSGFNHFRTRSIDRNSSEQNETSSEVRFDNCPSQTERSSLQC